jgi:FkbM family methyltransferase
MKFKRNSMHEGFYEKLLVWEFFGFRASGYFIEVGANDPKTLSQTWLLEKVGWRGILIEPLPDKSEILRRERPNSLVYPVAASSCEEAGEADFHVAADRSALVPNLKTHDVNYSRRIRVKVVTMDSILEEVKPERIDYMSIDTEGNELNVLKGFDLKTYRPSLMLIEDSVYTLDVHDYVTSKGYRLIRRTADNNWYVPGDSSYRVPLTDRIGLFRKMYLGTPLRRWKFNRKNRRPKTVAPGG